MANSVTYKMPSQPEWERLVNKPEIVSALNHEAVRAKGIAEALCQNFRKTGRYAASFEVRPGTTIVRRRPRVAAVVLNTVPYAAVVELRHHVLARTRDALAAP